MKHIIHFINFLFQLRGQLIIALLLFSTTVTAQETPPPEEFPIGASLDRFTRYLPEYYDSFRETGMNYMHQHAGDSSKSLLEDFNFTAYNSEYRSDLIYYYSTSFYSKWEAEEDQQTWDKVGIKHDMGSVAFWYDNILNDSVLCWSTKGLSAPACSLVYGPHYRQEKLYKRWYADSGYVRTDLKYTPRYKMALNNPHSVDSTQDVCRLYVVVRNVPDVVGGQKEDHVLKGPITLKVKDFKPYGTFKYFRLIDSTDYYRYPEKYGTPLCDSKTEHAAEQDTVWIDKYGDQGVEFFVDWLRTDTLCTLYIDNIEVYDNDGWNDFIYHPFETIQNIIYYAQSFPQSEWPNMKYWGGSDEPSSLDTYTPIKTVDAILQSAGAPRLITVFNPYWEITVNNDTQLVRYYNTVLPEKLIIDPLPFLPQWNPARFDDWDYTRKVLQICSTLQPGFWYQGQASGIQLPSGEWDTWRQPSLTEFKAQTMLALAHGVKGMFYWQYNSRWAGIDTVVQGIIKLNFAHTELWDVIHDNIVPRLKGKLGQTLLDLNYTGNYIFQECTNCPIHDGPELDYLMIDNIGSDYFWHAGFLTHKDYSDDQFFLLANLRTVDTVSTNLIVSNTTNYNNVSFRDIEGGVGRADTTIGYESSITFYETMPPGEGRLYQVAPVVKYGGRLLYDETISSTTTLTDDMTIEDDAVLTVNSTYNVGRSITIKDEGSIVTTNGGTMKFYNNERLIIEGAVTISGTFENPLVLDFLNPADSNGIIIRPGGSLTISYCQLMNAATGIFSELNANYINVQYSDFVDCGDNSISILGQDGDMEPTPVPQIISCSMTNSDYGISVSNLSSIIISYNTIMNTDCGIMLTNVSDAEIISNTIQSNTEEYPGIWYFSSGGVTRDNQISGHTSACFLANSSPKLGKNTLTSNKYHGIYVGSGSNPYMQGEYAGSPPNRYIVSGYNEIFENGGYQETGGPADNDGSEIYFSSSTSNAVLNSGCNSIYDDRQASPPLINTLLLMSGTSSVFPITVNARNNFWGDTVYAARFSGINVNYIPYEGSPCLDSQGGGEEDEMVLMNQFGQVIDTVYSTGMEVPELSETELIYAEAEESFLIGDLTSALQKYETIISSGVSDEEKYLAYERKYTIGKLQSKPVEFFNSLSSAFANLAGNTQDSLAIKKLTQLSTLSKVGEQEYENAIADFDGIVQSNPNTEEAVYAEIDALTTALLIEGNDSTLQKGTLGKYLIKSSADYHQKVDEILRKHFGGASKENGKELIPTEYTLYQNYPNPFNPVTTLKYDLPEASDVSLIIYDILGRKVKELVNTKQQAGRYEIQFNATNFASGVYIYRLIADNPSTSSGRGFVSSKKMILIK